ncbi:mycofactocin-coupled SDR family oxidoreductase [soil metagenome]
MGRLDGKVAFITGAARGQGRNHAIRLAEEGADIIAVDICKQIDTIPYALSRPEDLEETVALIEKLGRRVVAVEADVRDAAAMVAAVKQGVDELGRIDIVLANAGVAPHSVDEKDAVQVFMDTIAINLGGVRNAVAAAAPYMIAQGDGGAIVITSSTQGLSGAGGTGTGATDGYVASKHGVVGLMRSWANWLAPHMIRVNTVHPTGVMTKMIDNESMGAFVAQSPHLADAMANLMPVPVVDIEDITNAVLYLVSDDGRYVTGVTLPVDAGFGVK